MANSYIQVFVNSEKFLTVDGTEYLNVFKLKYISKNQKIFSFLSRAQLPHLLLFP